MTKQTTTVEELGYIREVADENGARTEERYAQLDDNFVKKFVETFHFEDFNLTVKDLRNIWRDIEVDNEDIEEDDYNDIKDCLESELEEKEPTISTTDTENHGEWTCYKTDHFVKVTAYDKNDNLVCSMVL